MFILRKNEKKLVGYKRDKMNFCESLYVCNINFDMVNLRAYNNKTRNQNMIYNDGAFNI